MQSIDQPFRPPGERGAFWEVTKKKDEYQALFRRFFMHFKSSRFRKAEFLEELTLSFSKMCLTFGQIQQVLLQITPILVEIS